MHVDALDEQLHDARLLGREQLVPDRGEVGQQDDDLALCLCDVIVAPPFAAAQVRATSSGAASNFWT
jgi:hypothetical protein